MFVTDAFGPTYGYAGETVTTDAPLTAEQHRACFDAAGIPAPEYDPTLECTCIEPPGAREAARLREHLRREHIPHECEVAVRFAPTSVAVAEFDALLEIATSEALSPATLAANAHAHLAHECGTSDEAAIAILHPRRGFDVTRRHIEAAQAHERTVRSLMSLAEGRDLEDGALDHAVHDREASAAAEINNGGLEAQVRYLVAHLGAAETEALLESVSG